MVQVAPALRFVPQLLVWRKLVAPVPAMEILVMLKAEFPTLVRVTACGELFVPTFWLPNVRLVGERPAVLCRSRNPFVMIRSSRPSLFKSPLLPPNGKV